MSATLRKFYNLFWENKACMNLFSLSKEELLDLQSVDIFFKTVKYSRPRIIVSNIDNFQSYALETIKNRTDSRNVDAEDEISTKFESLSPLFLKIYDEKLKKPIEKVIEDLEKKPLRFLWQFMRLVGSPENAEQGLIQIAKKYGVIGYHINSFNEAKEFLAKEYLNQKTGLVEEKNILLIEHFFTFLKDLHFNIIYKGLYESNQVLINSLHHVDNFQSRILLFHLLYEKDIIYSSNEDAILECTNCEKGTYRGAISLKISPRKLDNLKCPVCQNELAYFVPYELHNDLYEIIKDQDGLILHALTDLLNTNNLKFKLNKKFLNDIEIDCVLSFNDTHYIIEAKMYKLNTTKERLEQKIRTHTHKLAEDRVRLMKDANEKSTKTIELRSILLINIMDLELIQSIIRSLAEKFPDKMEFLEILNLPLLNEKIRES